MAGPLLLYSQRVVPARALAGGFRFAHPDLDEALADLLSGRWRPGVLATARGRRQSPEHR